MNESRYRQVSLQDVVEEYSASANAGTPFERAKWGSEASMVNRFHFALRTLPMEAVRTWLDIGCGEADFFTLAEQAGHRFDQLTGLDITPAMLARAREKSFHSPAEFIEGALDTAENLGRHYNLVTLLGVLQQCGMRPAEALRAAAKVVKPGGVLFATTKHLGWNEFTSGRLSPNENHSWFTMQELEDAVAVSGLTLVGSGGFLPRENREVPVEESHMVYLLARRP